MRKKRFIKFCRLQSNNEGAAGIIVAVMLIGLFFTFLSVIQLTYIPDWSEEREAEHMEKVAEQFTQLKFAVDVLSTIEQSGNKITTAITLGTNIFISNSTLGSVSNSNLLSSALGCRSKVITLSDLS